MRLDIYTILVFVTSYVLSRNIESSYVPTIAYRKKGIYDEHKFFMYSLFSWHFDSRVYIKTNHVQKDKKEKIYEKKIDETRVR